MAAALDFDSAYRALKRQAPAPVYYLSGDEEMLKEELLELILEASVDAASQDFNYDVRSAADLNGESFHALVETPPMLAERRVVVVKNVDQWRKNAKVWQVVRSYVESPSPSTVLVMTQGSGKDLVKDVAKRCTHVELDPLGHDRLLRWIRVRAERAGFEFGKDAAEHLLKSVGSNMSLLATEIDKLAVTAGDGESVNADTVADMVGVRRGETSQDWMRAVFLRDTPRATDMLSVVLEASGVSGVRLVATLGSGLIGVRLARALLDGGTRPPRVEGALRKATQRAKVGWMFRDWDNPFGLWAHAAELWTSEELDDALRAAYECDKALKSTTVSGERGTITEMLLKMSRLEVAV